MNSSLPKSVIKRDGREVPYQTDKVKNAIRSAMISICYKGDTSLDDLTNSVEAHISELGHDTITVEDIQDIVEKTFMEYNEYDILKEYMLYRNRRTRARESKTNIMDTMREITMSDAVDVDIKRENGNINTDSPMGAMLKYGSEVSKMFSHIDLLKSSHSKAHMNGDIHIHDLDFYATGTQTCIQIDILKLFEGGFSTGHGYLREPNSIRAAAALECIAIQSSQNDFHGGQSVPIHDYGLAKYVNKSFVKAITKYATLANHMINIDTRHDNEIKNTIEFLAKTYPNDFVYTTEDNINDGLVEILDLAIDDIDFRSVIVEAINDVEEETHQAMEAVIHNLNSMHCLPGSERIWVKDMNCGSLKLISMKDLHDNFEPMRYMAIAATKDFKNEYTFRYILNSKKQDNNRELVTVTTSNGCKVTVTTNHKILFKDDNGDFRKDVYDKIPNVLTLGASKNVVASNIASTTIFNSGDEYVYDISVDKDENFLTEHNVFVSNSRAGAQVPFSSLNFGTDTTDAGRLIIKETLEAINSGLGNGETAIFPISIFRVIDGINFRPGDPNYDLYKRAMEVTAKRLFPNFLFVDSPFNKKYYIPGKPETIVATMGCRTRVIGNINGPEISHQRGNLSFTSINLPRLAINANKDIDKFFDSLDDMMDLVADQLYQRYLYQAKKKVLNFPFEHGEGEWLDSDKLGANDTIGEVLKHGTLSIGFIGLAETLYSLIGKHHGESPEAQELGLKIIGHMRDMCDGYSTYYQMNYSLLATPAEGLSGRFIRMDKKRYGVIPGVTDKDYYVNSFHVPPKYEINAFDKIEIEAPYHALCNAGHISYVELNGDPGKNIDAIEELLAWMHDCGIGYGSINHPVDRDPVCGYTGIIDDVCPRCGRKEFEAVPVEKLKRLGVWKKHNSDTIGYSGDINENTDRESNVVPFIRGN